MSEIFSEIGRLLLTQDNRATSHPIFMVQQLTRLRRARRYEQGDCA